MIHCLATLIDKEQAKPSMRKNLNYWMYRKNLNNWMYKHIMGGKILVM